MAHGFCSPRLFGASHLSLRLRCWHSKWALIQVQAAPFPILFPAILPRKAVEVAQVFGPLSPSGRPEEALAQLWLL